MPQSKFAIAAILLVALCSFSANAFAPRSFLKRDSARSFLKRDATRSFLKREDPEVASVKENSPQPSGAEEPKQTEEKRFDLGGENFYAGMPPQMKRFEMFDGYYEQPWAYPHNKRFDYLDGFYSRPGPAASGFFPFYAPAKRFDYGFGPRNRQLAAFL